MIAFLYGTMKLAQAPVVRELRAMTSDLEEEVTEHTELADKSKRTWRRWSIVLAIALLGFLVLGIVAALSRPA